MQKYLRRILFNRWAAFFHDLFWVPAVLFAAYWFRFNLQTIPAPYLHGCLWLILFSIPVYGVVFWFFGLYRGLWRFASLQDLSRIVKSVTLGALVVTLLGAVFSRLEGIPRSVLLLSPILLIIGLTGPRLCYRWFKDQRLQLNKEGGRRTLIVGAGQAGELLLRDLILKQEYQPVAFVDDDRKKHNREIHGVRVYGGSENIREIVRLLDVDLVLFAIPSASRETVKRLVAECARAEVECKTLPSLIELSGNQVEAKQLRPVTLEDLLGRETVELDQQAIVGYLNNRTVLVTGGGGSIGSELCRQVAGLQPAKLIIFDHSEFNLYDIDYELRSLFPDLKIINVLGDLKNYDRVDWVFRKFTPDVVFHAAAYKHVPMLELNPAEGVQNNVFGTRMVADAADRYQVDRFVLVSTDKAVNPANVMGTTKRIAEIYCQNLDLRSQTKFITTRFGNVLGSAGSVVPLFEKQIKNGGPVTVTHREIKRYFMTIPEAVGLILQAGSMGKGGEIFVLEMGEPIYIRDLAEQMIRLSGLVPHRDIQIEYIGLRPGEKLFEEIFHESEDLRGTTHPKLQLASARQCDWDWLIDVLQRLGRAATSRDVPELINHLRQIVPEYNGLHVSDKEKKAGKTPLRVVEGRQAMEVSKVH
ncbi:MAG: polysaccharide biosynthesis protein [Desulfobacteraceae bacterium]|nr:MAG: polysaccharide biosynthesis protein [Desulfobacteraceae bacterium]